MPLVGLQVAKLSNAYGHTLVSFKLSNAYGLPVVKLSNAYGLQVVKLSCMLNGLQVVKLSTMLVGHKWLERFTTCSLWPTSGKAL